MEDQEVQVKRGPGRPPKEESGQISMAPEQLQALISALIVEARKPVRDPIKEQQQARMREHNKSGLEDNRQQKLGKFRSCSHMQRPGSILTGCSAVAWATQSDGKVRGVCQHCNTLFSPVKTECIDQEVFEAYKHLIRIPTHPAGNVSYTFQNA